MKRRLLSLLLSTSLVLSGLPMSVFAEEVTPCTHNVQAEGDELAARAVCGICGEFIADEGLDDSMPELDSGEELESETVTVTIEHEGVGSVYDVVPQNMMLFGLNGSGWDSSNTYYGQLDEDSQAAYTALKTAYSTGRTEGAVKIPLSGDFSYNTEQKMKEDAEAAISDAVLYALYALQYDCPDMSWLVNIAYSVGYAYEVVTEGETTTYTAKDFTFTLSSDTAQYPNLNYGSSALDSAVSAAKGVIGKDYSNDYDRLKAIHDYVCNYVKYTESQDLTQDKFQTVHSALIDKETVCAGYAKAFKILCDEYDIPCVLVSGTGTNSAGNSESHMWNYVQLDSNWYAVDCTWDDQTEKNVNKIFYDFFLVGSSTVAENFGGSTFGASHISSGQWGEDLSLFAYPTLSEEKYESSSGSDETELEIVYVGGSRQNTSDEIKGSGTEEDPYNDLETALQRVKTGGTIQVKDSITTIKPDGDIALNITKPVTIQGGMISCNYAGIVLGADVTLKDVSLSFNNSVRNVIIANGYTLTMNNVQKGHANHEIDLFCGAITQPQEPNNYPEAGNTGKIVISGNNSLGDIYAGNFSDLGSQSTSGDTVASHFAGNAVITIQDGTSGTLGNVYAYGARENREGTGNYNDMWTGNGVEENFTINGNVNVHLFGSLVKNIYGASDKIAHVTFASESLIGNINFNNIGTLEINGKLQPKTLNSGVDIILNDGGELDLSVVMSSNNNTFTVDDFKGGTNKGGILVLSENWDQDTQTFNPDTLTIAGDISGITQLQTDFNRTSEDTSGFVTDGHNYIIGTSVNNGDEFIFTPNESQSGASLKYGDGKWTALVEEEDLKLLTFSIDTANKSLSVDKDTINTNGVTVPVNCTFNQETAELSWVPLDISIVKDNGQEYKAVNKGDDYNYDYIVSALGMNIYGIIDDAQRHCIYICRDFDNSIQIAPGVYTIKVTAPTTGEETTETITLTVTEDAQSAVPNATLTPAVPDGTNNWYQSASLTAPAGYRISDSKNGTFSESITIPDGEHTNVSYWLKVNDSEETVSKTYGVVKVDGTAPENIQVNVSNITHNSAVIRVSATDATSGVPDSAAGYALTYVSGGTASVISEYTSGGTFRISGMQPNTSYTFKLTVTDNAGNTATKSDIIVTTAKMDLSGASVSLKAGVDYIYDGTAKQPTAGDLVVTLGNEAITLNDSDFIIGYENNINAGTNTKVIITATDSNATYKGAAHGTFSIAKRPLTILAQPQTIVTGEVISQELSMVSVDGSTSFAGGESLSAITLIADYTENKIMPSAAKIIKGNEDVTPNYNITYKEGILTIINPGISIDVSSAIVYDGNAVTVGTASSDSDITYTLTDCEDAEVTWYTKDDQNTALQSAPKDAGEYVVQITAQQIAGDASVSASKDFVIQKAELTATVGDQTITYGDVPPTSGSITYTGFVTGESESNAAITGEPVYSTTYNQYDDVDGIYSITSDMATVSAANYSFKVVDGTLTVNPLPVSLSWSGYTDRTYGDGKKVTAAVSNLVNNDAVQVTVTGGEETSVGTHTAKVIELTGVKAKNYTLTGAALEQPYTIEKADALENVTTEKKVRYNQSSGTVQISELGLSTVINPVITAAVKGEGADSILESVTVVDGAVDFRLKSLSNADVDKTAEITVTVTSDTHEDMTVVVTVKIVAKTVVDDQITLTVPAVIYGEAPAPVAVFAGTKDTNPTEKYTYKKLDGTGGYEELDELKNSSGYLPVGTYEAAYTYEDDSQIGFRKVSFEVKPKELTVTLNASGVTKVYDKTASISGEKQPTLTLSGHAGSENPVLDTSSVLFQYADGNTGTDKIITASGIKLSEVEVNKNYTVADAVSGKGAVITAKAMTVTPVQDYTKVYGEKDPDLEYTTEGLLSGDVLSGALSREKGENAGAYRYDASTLTNSNYTIKLSEETGLFTITQEEITLTLDSDVVTQKAGSKVKLTVTAQSKKELQAADTSQPTAVFMDGVVFASKGNGVFEADYTVPSDKKPGEEITLTVKNTDPNYKSDASAELILTISSGEKTALPFPEEMNGKNAALQMEKGITDVPKAFKYLPLLDTAEKIEEALKTEIQKKNAGVSAQNTDVYDVTLMYSPDEGKNWVKADKDHWPESGKLTIVLPYPKGTGKDTHKFVVAHMFTEKMGTHEPGTFEYPEVTNTEEGIRFQVSGLSPISLGWTETAISGGSGSSDDDDSDSTSDTAQPVSGGSAPSTVTGISSANTGDDQDGALWLMLALLSAICLIGIYMKGRKH